MGQAEKMVLSPPEKLYDAVIDPHPHVEEQRSDVPLCGSFRLVVCVSCSILISFMTFYQQTMTAAIVAMSTVDAWSNEESMPNISSNVSLKNESHPRSIQWDKTTESEIVSFFFIGYFIVQLPSGYFVVRFGAKNVCLSGLLVSSALQILTVPAYYQHVGWLLAARFWAGLASGFMYGSANDLMAKWTPRHETSILFGILAAGITIGPSMCFVVSLTTNTFCSQGGWREIFYIPGGIGLVMFIVFSITLSDSPLTNRFVSPPEANFIKSTRAPHLKCKIPTLSILRSTVVWAVLFSQLATDWMSNVIMTQFPLYYKHVTDLTATQVNILGVSPLFSILVFIAISGNLADHSISKGWLSRTMARKLFDGLSKMIAVTVCVSLCFLPRGSFGIALAINLLAAVSLGFTCGAGFVPNQGEIGPAFTAFICGFCQTGAMWVGFTVPLIFGHLTPHNEIDEWQAGFFITTGVQIVVFIIFSIFGSGEIQPWATDTEVENDLSPDNR